MIASARTAPPNSLILVGDADGWVVPTSMDSLIAATNSCIAVGCRAEVDGETEFILGSANEVNPGAGPDFEGVIDTPNRRLAIRSVLGVTILEAPVAAERTTVRVWVNDPSEPDRVIVGVD